MNRDAKGRFVSKATVNKARLVIVFLVAVLIFRTIGHLII